jgi:glucose uptake protein GlcU
MAGMYVVSSPVGLGVLFGAMNLIGAVFGVAAAVYQMTMTPHEMQGRVAAVAGLVTAAGSTAGALAFSSLIDRFDGPTAILLSAGGMALVALAALLVPAMRRARLVTGTPVAPAAEAADPTSV